MPPEAQRDEGQTTMTHSCRLTSDWVPLPDTILKLLGWQEGARLELEVVADHLIVSLSSDQQSPKKPGASIGKRLILK